MKYFEFGQEHPELMVMLHGGVCYRGALTVAEKMAKTYHVVLVAYPELCLPLTDGWRWQPCGSSRYPLPS